MSYLWYTVVKSHFRNLDQTIFTWGAVHCQERKDKDWCFSMEQKHVNVLVLKQYMCLATLHIYAIFQQPTLEAFSVWQVFVSNTNWLENRTAWTVAIFLHHRVRVHSDASPTQKGEEKKNHFHIWERLRWGEQSAGEKSSHALTEKGATVRRRQTEGVWQDAARFKPDQILHFVPLDFSSRNHLVTPTVQQFPTDTDKHTIA